MSISRLFETALVYFLYTLFFHAVVADESCTLQKAPLFLRIGNCTINPNSDYPDGVDSWGIRIGIASPEQDLCFLTSLVVNNTVVMANNICTSDNSSMIYQCISRRGGVFNENQTTSDFIISSQADLAPDPVWDSFNPPFAKAANATIQLASDISLPSYPIGLVELAPNSSVSQLGLANDSVFLRELVNAGLTSVPAFGLLAGSQSVQQPRDGHLIVGGYDSASLNGPFVNYTMSNTTAAGDRVCSLQVEVDELILSRPGQDDFQLVSKGTPMTSCIEPLDNLFRFPPDVLSSFQTSTGWINDTSLVSNSLYIVEPGLYYNSSFNGTLIFTLKSGQIIEIPTEELAQPLRGIDRNGKRILQSNVTVVGIFDQPAPENTATLGNILLSQMYLTINYPLQQFQLAPAVTETVPPPVLVSFGSGAINCTPSPRDNTYIGVVVVGCVLAVIILIVLCVYVSRRLKQDKSITAQPNDYQEATNHVDNSEKVPHVTTIPHEPLNLQGDRQNGIRGSVASQSTAHVAPGTEPSCRKSSFSTIFSTTRTEPTTGPAEPAIHEMANEEPTYEVAGKEPAHEMADREQNRHQNGESSPQ